MKNASVLNVLAEAKNGDICPYNLVYLEVSLFVGQTLTDLWTWEESSQDHAMTCQPITCKFQTITLEEEG